MTLLPSCWPFKRTKPDALWVAAFTAGYRAAWETMAPLMREGLQKSYQVILDEAAQQTLEGLEATIVRRIEEAGQTHLQPTNTVLAKREEFKRRATTAVASADKSKYETYVTCLDWVVQAIGPNGH